MKKVLILLALLAVIIAAGITFLIATFNINSYKGALVSQLEGLTGNTVEIGRLWLEWKGRLVLGVEGFTVLTEAPGGQKIPALSFDRAVAAVELLPLLGRKLQVSSITLDGPQITIVRTEEGRIVINGYNARPTSPSGPATDENTVLPAKDADSAGVAQAFSFDVSSLTIRNGAIRFIDRMSSPAADIVLRKLDASITNISMATPITFAVKTAIAGARQDLDVSGTLVGLGGLLPGQPVGDIFLRDFNLETDLASFGHAEIISAMPVLEKIGLRQGLAGILKASVKELHMTGAKVAALSGDFKFTDGRLVLAQMRAPIDGINLTIVAEGTTVTAQSFSARLGNGLLHGSAVVNDVFTAPRASFEVTAKASGLRSFLSSVFAMNLNLDGDAEISFKGAMSGTTWPDISRTLTGRGDIALQNGVISNSNMLNESLGALTLFPNLLASVEEQVPASLRQVMSEKYTPLRPLRQSFTVEGGYIMMPDLIFASSDIDMRGEGKVSFTGDLSGSGMIRFSPAISNAMVLAVPQMKAITDAQGLITFPLAFKGGSGGFKVIPDMKYIGQRVAVQVAGDTVSGYLQKVMDKGQGASAGEQAPAEVKALKLKDILKAFSEQSKSSQ